MTKELLQQALEALKNSCDFIFKDVTKSHLRHQAIAALEAAIAQPVAQRVVAWMTEDGRVATDVTKQGSMSTSSKVVFNIPLYTSQAIAQPADSSKDAKIAQLLNLLVGDNGALARMERARGWLTNDNPRPVCNWGVLDTGDLRAAIAQPKNLEGLK